MKLASLVGCVGLAGSGLYMSGAFSAGEVDDRPVADVRRVVENTPVWMKMNGIFEGPADRPIHVATTTGEDGSVVWRFTDGGHELQVVRASIVAEGRNRTRVSVDATPGDALERRIPGAAKMIGSDMIQDLIELAFAEQIDARMESRPFDKARVDRAAMTYLASHPREAAEFRLAASESFEMKEPVQHMHPSVEPDAASTSPGEIQPMTDARPMIDARPTTDLSKYR
jgi:hypothetical protein